MSVSLIQNRNAPVLRYAYHVAGCRVRSDRPLIGLVPSSVDFSPAPCAPPPSTAGSGCLYHTGTHLVAGVHRPVEAWLTADGPRVHIGGLADIHVTNDGTAVIVDATEPDAAPHVVQECLVGPALILALAYRGVFCLHAAAINAGARAIALCGESGTGKSTLAASFPDAARLADDILPIQIQGPRVRAYTDYPQFKLGGEPPVAARARSATNLDALWLLTPRQPTGAVDVETRPSTSREAALALVRHTVAAKLFPPALLAQHLRFCIAVAERIPAGTIDYPKLWSVLPALRRTIMRQEPQRDPEHADISTSVFDSPTAS